MASFSIRKLDDAVYQKLRIRAAKHGISMEEEVRQIITHVVAVPDDISQVFTKHFGTHNGVDLESPDPKTSHQPMDFDE